MSSLLDCNTVEFFSGFLHPFQTAMREVLSEGLELVDVITARAGKCKYSSEVRVGERERESLSCLRFYCTQRLPNSVLRTGFNSDNKGYPG